MWGDDEPGKVDDRESATLEGMYLWTVGAGIDGVDFGAVGAKMQCVDPEAVEVGMECADVSAVGAEMEFVDPETVRAGTGGVAAEVGGSQGDATPRQGDGSIGVSAMSMEMGVSAALAAGWILPPPPPRTSSDAAAGNG